MKEETVSPLVSRRRSLTLSVLLAGALAAAFLAGTPLAAAQAGPASTSPAQAPRPLTDDQAAVVAIGVLALTIIPVVLGIKAAKRKGISPHWMWFGLHPLGGWIAYLIIRGRPDRRAAAPPRLQPASIIPPAEPVRPPKPTIGREHGAEGGAAKPPAAGKPVNRGDRQDTLQQAMAYWVARFSDPVKDPFVMYFFDAETDARAALLELPCILEGGDGKLICTEPLTFGYSRQADGRIEAVVCGAKLTHELWEQAKRSFEKHGGRRKNDLEPERAAGPASPAEPSTAPDPTVPSFEVTFVREDRQPTKLGTGTATYRIHRGPNEAAARVFLEQRPVTTEFLYLVVETPEGCFGRDIQGIYKEPGSGPIAPPGPDRPPAAAPMSDHTMFKTLADLCAAYQRNDRAEIARLEPEATMIGQELDRRGGKRAMLAMWERLGNRPGSRTLDMHWDGIGDWQG